FLRAADFFSMIFKVILIALLVSESLQRNYHNGRKSWEANCDACKLFTKTLRNQVKDRKSMTEEEYIKNAPRYCGDNKVCATFLPIKYLGEKMQKLTNNYSDFSLVHTICTSDLGGFSLCPPTHKRSMYDNPEFPELRLDEETKRNFSRLLHSMTKPEL
ncbi:hypothetical protein PMAYCL1PPCAC_28812, partial [Pristionchus mayeri]